MTDDNVAVRSARRYLDALFARDWATVADTLADTYRFEDRRVGMGTTHDKAAELQQARALADLGLDDYDLQVVDTGGARSALVRATWSAGGFAVDMLFVVKVDDQARAYSTVVFDIDDVNRARTELDARDGEGDT